MASWSYLHVAGLLLVDSFLEFRGVYPSQENRERCMLAKTTRIVTADDDPQLLRLMARNLEFEDYQVLTASDGKQG